MEQECLTSFHPHGHCISSMNIDDSFDTSVRVNVHTGEWSTGLCACCDPTKKNCCNSCCFCLTALMFPYCAQGALLNDAGLVNDCVGASCVFWFLYSVPLLPQFLFCNLRRNIAQVRGIKESYLTSILYVLYCFPCAMTQVYNDLVLKNYKFEENKSAFSAFAGNVRDKTAFLANTNIQEPFDSSLSYDSINGMHLGMRMRDGGNKVRQCCCQCDKWTCYLCCECLGNMGYCCMAMAHM